MAQSVEHIVHIDGVTGSSPVATTMSKLGKLLAELYLFLSASSFTPMEVQSRRPLCGIQANLNGSSPVWSAMSSPASCLPGFFFFPRFFIVRTDGGSKSPPAVRDSGEFERFESCFVRHIQSGKLLAGLFLFLSASLFTPMEVQSRRPLCGIQADLNGSSPVLSAMSGSASCLPGFFFFLAYAIIFPLLEARCSL